MITINWIKRIFIYFSYKSICQIRKEVYKHKRLCWTKNWDNPIIFKTLKYCIYCIEIILFRFKICLRPSIKGVLEHFKNKTLISYNSKKRYVKCFFSLYLFLLLIIIKWQASVCLYSFLNRFLFPNICQSCILYIHVVGI